MKHLEYKGYKGTIEYSQEDNCFFGRVINVNDGDLVLYEGTTIKDLQKDFKEAVTLYIEYKISK